MENKRLGFNTTYSTLGGMAVGFCIGLSLLALNQEYAPQERISWETIIAGFLGLAGGSVAWFAVRRQIAEQKSAQEKVNIARNLNRLQLFIFRDSPKVEDFIDNHLWFYTTKITDRFPDEIDIINHPSDPAEIVEIMLKDFADFDRGTATLVMHIADNLTKCYREYERLGPMTIQYGPNPRGNAANTIDEILRTCCLLTKMSDEIMMVVKSATFPPEKRVSQSESKQLKFAQDSIQCSSEEAIRFAMSIGRNL